MWEDEPNHFAGSAISLTQITSTLLELEATDANLVLGMHILQRLSERIAFIQVDPDMLDPIEGAA